MINLLKILIMSQGYIIYIRAWQFFGVGVTKGNLSESAECCQNVTENL